MGTQTEGSTGFPRLLDGPGYREREHGYQLDSRTPSTERSDSSVDAPHTPARNLNTGRTAVVRNAPGASLPSVRGTIMAAFGAITSLGCAAAIGLVSIAGPTAPKPPGTHQPPVPPHSLVARP